MSGNEDWFDLGSAVELSRTQVQRVVVRNIPIALSCVNGVFGAVSNICNHAGGPLSEGSLDGAFLVCPWHHWKFDRRSGHRNGDGNTSRREEAGSARSARKPRLQPQATFSTRRRMPRRRLRLTAIS